MVTLALDEELIGKVTLEISWGLLGSQGESKKSLSSRNGQKRVRRK